MVPAVPPPVTDPVGGRGDALPQGWFRNVQRTVSSIFEGLAITMSWMFRRPITVQYPDKIEAPIQDVLPDAYRGILELDVRLCTGCLLCEKTCPIQCIAIGIEKVEGGGRNLTKFDIDISKCMYCGLCQESCNFDALRHSAEFEATQRSTADLLLHFVSTPQPVAKFKAGEAPARRPRGEILKEVIPGFRDRPGKRPGDPTPPPPPLPPRPAPAAAPVPPPEPQPAAPAAAPAPEKKEETP
jgi:NADH-quinone oxidoreductase subunit I